MTSPRPPRRQRRLSNLQIYCIVALWCSLVFYIFTYAARIDGPLVLTIAMSGVIVGIPIVRELQRRRHDKI